MAPTPELRTAVLLRSEQSGGHVSLMENIVSAGSAGPPLHRHDFDEAFYILEGELVFQIGDERFTRRAGEFAFAPRNVVHALANHYEMDARYLLVCTPAGLERHFALATAVAQGVEAPDWALQPSPEITVVGPQLAREE
jgi:quercetin dioxygenase-like cupin family protein